MQAVMPEKESQATAGIGGALWIPLRYAAGGIVGVAGVFATLIAAAGVLCVVALRLLGEVGLVLAALFFSFGRGASLVSSSRAQDIAALFWWGYGVVVRVGSFFYAISLSFFKT